ncbi:hypothetical protein BpHYR1_041270 [Brachionus plicatilis]|uniref:CCHC-type domain-containing protein n=1 Tax=Brachionus plicatilis TaxID=10195 RepID=A0A3M7R9H2_BRAPC|nr:hypothetical protein BpHYR1_041270 [Brachionus plicatilis]
MYGKDNQYQDPLIEFASRKQLSKENIYNYLSELEFLAEAAHPEQPYTALEPNNFWHESISCQNPQVGIEISKILTRELFPIVEFGYRICLGGRLLSKHFDHLFFQFKHIHRSLMNSEFEPTQTIVVQKGCNIISEKMGDQENAYQGTYKHVKWSDQIDLHNTRDGEKVCLFCSKKGHWGADCYLRKNQMNLVRKCESILNNQSHKEMENYGCTVVNQVI